MDTKIVSHGGNVAGWIDRSIHDFLEVLSPNWISTEYALISCLDSNRNPASIRKKSPELKTLSKEITVLGSGLLIPTGRLAEANTKNQIFFGFDELWFFPTESITPKPPSISLVGPSRINSAMLREMTGWMKQNSCSMALGSGEGLNFVVKAHGLVRYILGFSIEQPEPSLAST